MVTYHGTIDLRTAAINLTDAGTWQSAKPFARLGSKGTWSGVITGVFDPESRTIGSLEGTLTFQGTLMGKP